MSDNIPTNPSLWSRIKAQAKSKFDVYPSAYANGWAAKKYKAAGGGWKKGTKKESFHFTVDDANGNPTLEVTNYYSLDDPAIAEDLRKWFGKGKEGGWDRYNTKGEKVGKCARDDKDGDGKGDGPKPKCLSNEKAAKMSKDEIASSVKAKRRKDPDADRKGAPINVKNKGLDESMKTARANVGKKSCWNGYKAKGTKEQDGKLVPNCVKEGKSFAEFCAESKSRIEADSEYQKRFKSLADNVATKGKKKETTKEEFVSEQPGDGYLGPARLKIKNPMASDATRSASDAARKAKAKQNLKTGAKPTGGLMNRLQSRADMIDALGEEYKDLPRRKVGMKAGKKILSAIGHAAKAGEDTDERNIEPQVRMHKANKKGKQAEKMHDTAKRHNPTLSKAKSLKNKLTGEVKRQAKK